MRRIMSSILSLLPMFLAVAIMAPRAQAAAWLPSAPTVLITGANRGIGLELAKQYAAGGWNVIATSRHRPGDAATAELRSIDAGGYVAVEQLDVTDNASIRAVALKYRDRPIDVLINNAARLDPKDGGMTPLEQLDLDAARMDFDVNSLGPMRVTQSFLSNVERSTQKKVVNITTLAASFSPDPSEKALPPTGLTYAASKTALNMYSSRLATRLKPKGIIVALVTPTLVASKPGMESFAAPLDSEVAKFIKLIDRMTLAQSGVIFNTSTGKRVPF